MRALRVQAAVFERYRGFDRCMRKLAVAEGEAIPFTAVAELFAHWGDPLSQSDESYLRSCLAEAARTTRTHRAMRNQRAVPGARQPLLSILHPCG
jgi:hypothetical protein